MNFKFVLCNEMDFDEKLNYKPFKVERKEDRIRDKLLRKDIDVGDDIVILIPFNYTIILNRVFDDVLIHHGFGACGSVYAKYINGKFGSTIGTFLTEVSKILGDEFPDTSNPDSCTKGNCNYVIKRMIKACKLYPDGRWELR